MWLWLLKLGQKRWCCFFSWDICFRSLGKKSDCSAVLGGISGYRKRSCAGAFLSPRWGASWQLVSTTRHEWRNLYVGYSSSQLWSHPSLWNFSADASDLIEQSSCAHTPSWLTHSVSISNGCFPSLSFGVILQQWWPEHTRIAVICSLTLCWLSSLTNLSSSFFHCASGYHILLTNKSLF